MSSHPCLATTLVIILFVFLTTSTMPSFAYWNAEEAAEKICSASDVVDCGFDDSEAIYYLGSHSPLEGGTGKIRAQAAYCLIRDDRDAVVDASFGDSDDWYQFGAKSRFHLTHAGKNSQGVYSAKGQRLLDVIIFGHALENFEAQELSALFPMEEKSVPKPKCRKKIKVGNKFTCSQYEPTLSAGKGYYLNLKTESYYWEFDFAAILDEVFDIQWDGFAMTFGQNALFQYGGFSQLSGTALNLTDGVLPGINSNLNSWEWGVDPSYDPDTTYLDVKIPVASAWATSVNILIDIGLHGFYQILEGNSSEGPQDFSASDPDGYQTSASSTDGSVSGGTTSTNLASGTDINVAVQVCINFGWFGTQCGDFQILPNPLIDSEVSEALDPINYVSYEANGNPLALQWQNGNTYTGMANVNTAIEACLAAPTIHQAPEEMATPTDITGFMHDVGASFDEHFFICEKNEPNAAAVAWDDPEFKLCDDLGHVYEAINGIYPQN